MVNSRRAAAGKNNFFDKFRKIVIIRRSATPENIE